MMREIRGANGGGSRRPQFWTYDQNNSGGRFDLDERAGIGHYVIVEAHDAKDADRRAEGIGLYFGGVAAGRDCECCGDRWSPAWEEGTEGPQVYGEPAEEGMGKYRKGYVAYVHYLDGRIVEVRGD